MYVHYNAQIFSSCSMYNEGSHRRVDSADGAATALQRPRHSCSAPTQKTKTKNRDDKLRRIFLNCYLV